MELGTAATRNQRTERGADDRQDPPASRTPLPRPSTPGRIGTIVESEVMATSMHLVEANVQWRWFFGTSGDVLAALPTDCDLGGAG